MNKLIIAASVFLLTSIRLFAQTDCLDKIAQQAVEISKLKEEVNQTKDLLAVRQVALQSLRKDSAFNSVKLKECDSNLIKFNATKNELVDCNLKLIKLAKDTIGLSSFKVQRNRLDSIEQVLSMVSNNISVLEKSKGKLEIENSEFVRGRGRLDKIINDRYQGSFDLLVKNSTLESLGSDLMVTETLKVESNLTEKINKLKLYKEYEQLIGQKLNESKIEDAKRYLIVYNKEKSVSDLVNLLSNYKEKNEAIKQMINELQNKNAEKSKVAALIVEKKEKTMYLIENYISLYSIDLNRYSYLNQIVSELRSRKLQNVDADVLDFLERL